MRRWFRMLLCLGFLIALAGGQARAGEPTGAWSIRINLPEYRVWLNRGGQPYRTYPIAIGKPVTPTPTGQYTVLNRVKNPVWYPPDGRKPVPPGPSNPLGPWWMGITKNGIGLHGGGNEKTVGTAVSMGCMRMLNHHVTEVASLVTVGTPVTIEYELIRAVQQKDGWQAEILNNIYKKPLPTQEQMARAFERAGYGEQTDWLLVYTLVMAKKKGTIPMPVRTPLFISGTVYHAYWTPDETWLPLEAVWGLITMAGIGNYPCWWEIGNGLVYAGSENGPEQRYVVLSGLKTILEPKLALQIENERQRVVITLKPVETAAEAQTETAVAGSGN